VPVYTAIRLDTNSWSLAYHRNFKLDNRLREAEPKIKKIGDYEKQIDVFEENQLLW